MLEFSSCAVLYGEGEDLQVSVVLSEGGCLFSLDDLFFSFFSGYRFFL